jgi:putative ABC transport system ATP-binding protein
VTAVLPPIIELAGVQKTYLSGGQRGVAFRALNGVDLAIAAGEMVAVTGPSGSGKTTIINLIAGIDRPTAGAVTVSGSRLDRMTEEQLAVWRGRTVGIVFQFFQLMPTLTATENATLPLDLARLGPSRERKAVACRNLATVGLGGRARPAAARAVRRRAAARRDRQGDGLRAADPARRRADGQPRHGPGHRHVQPAQRSER